MKVLIPSYDNQLFIQEVIKCLGNSCDITESFEDFWLCRNHYDIIHLQWPEYLFKWRLPSDLELLLLTDVLSRWKSKGTRIVITRHNYLPHRPNNLAYEALYRCVYSNVDGVVHLGHFSVDEFEERYEGKFLSDVDHRVVLHPIFTSYPDYSTYETARNHLNFGDSDFVILVFGEVRTAKEKKFILDFFAKIKRPGKKLMVPNWKFSESKEPLNAFRWELIKRMKRFILLNEYIPLEEVHYYVNAADLVLIPRIDTLNSGVPFLTIGFNTPTIGFKAGNLGEHLGMFNMNILENFDDLDSVNTCIQQMHHSQKSKEEILSFNISIGQGLYKFYKDIIS